MVKNEIEELLKPVVEDLGCELWGCDYLGQGRRPLLRLYIDKVGGVNIKDCERVSKQVSALLNIEDPIPGNYTLEVSSPGINRPLFHGSQYKQYIGYKVRLKLMAPLKGSRNVLGTITSVDQHGLILNDGEEPITILFSQITKANLTGERGNNE